MSTLIMSEVPESVFRLEHVSDDHLLTATRQLVGRSNQLLATLLAHLAEVEARGIHRQRACASLYTYCIYELRLSEDAAFRRARAAKLARQFPVIFQQIADGELQLTTLLLLAPHLTEANHLELLALAKYRTKREVLRLVRSLSPEPDVPDRVEPLGPERRGIGMTLPSTPSWNQFVESYAPSVRELRPGERPKDWVDLPGAGVTAAVDATAPTPAEVLADVPVCSVPQRYRIEFTASQKYADLLERAQDLLSHAVPSRSLEEVHVRALRLLVEKLERRKYGAPRAAAPTTVTPTPQAPEARESAKPASVVPASKKHTHAPRQRVLPPAAVRRDVRDRDGNRCTFVDDRGQRCRETRLLQLHHIEAHANGGDPSVENLTQRCQAHNALAAEQDFGRAFIQRQRDGRKTVDEDPIQSRDLLR